MFDEAVTLPAAPHQPPAVSGDSGLDAQYPPSVAAICAPADLCVGSPSRRNWFKLSFAACGAALALGAAPSFALSQTDDQSFQFLLELEDFQHEFFDLAQRSGMAVGLTLSQQDILHLIAEQDREHREWARMAIQKFGVSPLQMGASNAGRQTHWSSRYSFPEDAFDHGSAFFPLAIRLKEWSVQAYHGLVQRSHRGDIMQALASLAGIEGRHAAALREAAGINPLPSPFESYADPAIVTAQLAPYGFRGEYLI